MRFFPTFFVFLGLAILIASTAPKEANAWGYSPYTLIEAEMECGKDKKGKKGYKSKLMGLVNETGISFIKSWYSTPNKQQQMASGSGMILANKKLVIKGQGQYEKKKSRWDYFFSVESSGNIIKDLEKGVPGREGSGQGQRECTLRLVKHIKASLAFNAEGIKKDLQKLRKENRDLGSQNANLENEIERLKLKVGNADTGSSSIGSDDSEQLNSELAALQKENAELKVELNAAVLAKATSQSSAGASEEVDSLKSEIAALEEALAKANDDIAAASQPSTELLSMAAAISELQGQLQASDQELARLEQSSGQMFLELEEELNKEKASSQSLQATIAQKDEDLKNLQVALKTMQSLAPSEPKECEPALAEPTSDDLNNPVIAYLEAKTKDLEKKLESCGTPTASTKKAKGSNNQEVAGNSAKAPLTDLIFEKQWELEGAPCSRAYNTFHRVFGSVFYIAGDPQFTDAPVRSEVTQLADNRVQITTTFGANDFMLGLNNGNQFTVAEQVRTITLVNENQIEYTNQLKNLNTSQFMSNPSNKSYETSTERGQVKACGPKTASQKKNEDEKAKSVEMKVSNNAAQSPAKKAPPKDEKLTALLSCEFSGRHTNIAACFLGSGGSAGYIELDSFGRKNVIQAWEIPKMGRQSSKGLEFELSKRFSFKTQNLSDQLTLRLQVFDSSGNQVFEEAKGRNGVIYVGN